MNLHEFTAGRRVQHVPTQIVGTVVYWYYSEAEDWTMPPDRAPLLRWSPDGKGEDWRTPVEEFVLLPDPSPEQAYFQDMAGVGE